MEDLIGLGDAWEGLSLAGNEMLRIQNCRHHELDPHKRLLLTILEDEVRCCRRYFEHKHVRHMRLYSEARRWIMSHDEKSSHSFVNCCRQLGINPDALRDALLKLG